jgi:hypothetical protein
MSLQSWGFTIDLEAEDLRAIQNHEDNNFFIEIVN